MYAIRSYYDKIGLPVGFKDRDIVLDNKINKLSNGYKIELKTASDKYSLQNNYVRITDAYGYWLFEQNGTNSDVTYQFYSDPKGSFPSWLRITSYNVCYTKLLRF